MLTYNCQKAVDDVSVGVSRDAVSALLGSNGEAGKTTTFNLIREHITPCIPSQHVLSKILGGDKVRNVGDVTTRSAQAALNSWQSIPSLLNRNI